MQIDRSQALDPGHADGRVVQGIDERSDEVAGRYPFRVEDHDDGSGGASHCGLQRVARAEGCDGADDLVGGPLDQKVALGYRQDLRAGRTVCGEAPERCVGRGAAKLRDDDDGGGRQGGFPQPRRHRLDRAVEHLTVHDHVGRSRRGEFEGRPEVDDAPAGGLDAGLELVGRGPVVGDTRGGALLGQCHELRRYR